jgi:hypothetical protein
MVGSGFERNGREGVNSKTKMRAEQQLIWKQRKERKQWVVGDW